MNDIDPQNFDILMGALGEQLTRLRADPFELVICGGAALGALGLVLRTTRDVDVLALVVKGTIAKADPFPEALAAAASRVAADFQLPSKWLNPGPTSLVDGGLPDGLAERWRTRPYGASLTVHFIDRLDQIHLKLYAAVDRGPQDRHYADLLALHPTREEIQMAARWAMRHDVSEPFRDSLRACLRALGHDDVIANL
jgi:hypothetical protein